MLSVGEREHLAAQNIQRMFRGFCIRKDRLTTHAYAKYQILCNNIKPTTPRAHAGKSLVYMPYEDPNIVIKCLGRVQSVQRFHVSQKGRKLLRKGGCTRVIIPRTVPCGAYLIEERLPVQADPTYNVELYMRYRNCFNRAVQEMVFLFSQANLPFLISRDKDQNILSIRYDNIGLYRDSQGNGCIGLVDVERMRFGSPLPQDVERGRFLVSIFPYHKECIVEHMNQYLIPYQQQVIQENHMKGKEYAHKIHGHYMGRMMRFQSVHWRMQEK